MSNKNKPRSMSIHLKSYSFKGSNSPWCAGKKYWQGWQSRSWVQPCRPWSGAHGASSAPTGPPGARIASKAWSSGFESRYPFLLLDGL